MSKQPLLQPYPLGDLQLKNRMVMAPMTRNRAQEGNVPHTLNIEYYRQRSGAGLIVTEGSQVEPRGQGYPFTPGIHSAEQVAGWKLITQAVHENGGRIFLQLWHVGRISHPDFHGGDLPIAPSAIPPSNGQVYTFEGLKDFHTPRAMGKEDIQQVIASFRKGAENAKAAGFDGVEIHGANGYLLDQFLQDSANQREDNYGGSIENRARFVLEVVEAVLQVFPKERVGIRLSPSGLFNIDGDSESRELFSYLIKKLNDYGLAYLHLIRPFTSVEEHPNLEADVISFYGAQFNNTVIANGGYNQESGNAEIENGEADLISFGVPFLANPDLPRRFEQGAELNNPDKATFYGGDEKGYTDYPFLEEATSDA